MLHIPKHFLAARGGLEILLSVLGVYSVSAAFQVCSLWWLGFMVSYLQPAVTTVLKTTLLRFLFLFLNYFLWSLQRFAVWVNWRTVFLGSSFLILQSFHYVVWDSWDLLALFCNLIKSSSCCSCSKIVSWTVACWLALCSLLVFLLFSSWYIYYCWPQIC